MSAPMFRYNKLMYLNGKISTKDESKLTQHKETSKTAVQKLVRLSREDKAPSNQRFLLSNRKSFENTSVLTRLNYLENELKIAKTQIKNDSEIIRGLNNMIRINNKTSMKTNSNEFLTSGDDKDKIDNKEQKDVMIDLKNNLKDFKKLINLKPNEMLGTNTIAKDDNVDNNKNDKTIIRKFDFDKTEYNKRNRDNITTKDREKKFILFTNQDKSNFKYSTKPQRGYLSDGDTYERVEERIYDSDSNKRKPNASDKGKAEKQNNYNDVKKSTEKRTVFETDDRETNEDNKRKYDSYSSLKYDRENKVGKSDQYILSSSVKLKVDEAKTNVPIKNTFEETKQTTEVIKSVYDNNRENDNFETMTTDLAVEKYEKENVHIEENQFKFKTGKSVKTDVERNNGDSSEKNIKQKRFRAKQ